MNSGSDRAVRTRRVLLLWAILISAWSADAELQIGNNIALKMNGSAGYGYNTTFGNSDRSTHGQNFVGAADADGYYFHPNFASFQLRSYASRDQLNVDSQNLSRTTGIGASVSLFGVSRFPGSISYGMDFSNSSEFRVAGVPTVTGNGSGRNFGVTWSALVPNFPTLTVSFSSGSSNSSLMDSASSETVSRNVTMTSGYQIAGFNCQANFSRYFNRYKTPAYLTATGYSSEGSGTTYGASLSHSLPLRGSLGLSWSYGSSDSSTGSTYGGSSYMVSNSFSPWRRLSVYQSASYMSNLFGALTQSIVNGVSFPSTLQTSDSNGLFYNTGASFYFGHGISVGGYYNHRVQNFSNKSYSDSQYGGSLNFHQTSRLFGFLNFGVGVADTASARGNNGAGINASVSASRHFGPWDTYADFSYSQNVMTIGSVLTTSTYSYGGTARRKINRQLSFSGGYRSGHSGLVVQAGDGNSSNSFFGSLQWKRYSLTGSYSQSSGTAVLNSAGTLTPTPLGQLISNDILLYNARSYSAGASATLFRRITVDGGYAWFRSATTSKNADVWSTGNRYSARVQYPLRKFQIGGGFSRSMQEVSAIPGTSPMVNSLYVNFSRWFNVF